MLFNDTTRPAFITLTSRAKDLTGQRFGRLVALGPVGRTSSGNAIWLCQCDCGNTSSVSNVNLRSRASKSCGCLQRELIGAAQTTHGLRYDPLYNKWRSMIKRCTHSTHKSYAHYGGRGIAICKEWLHDFRAFYDYVSALSHFGKKGYTLDRIDNDGNYEPGNMRWATPTEQNRNQRSNHNVAYNGKVQSIAAWADELGVRRKTLVSRLTNGWDVERAFTTPVQSRRRRLLELFEARGYA